MQSDTVLLVVDVQSALIDGKPYQSSRFLKNIASLLNACRGCGIEAVFVRHDGGPGDELQYGTPGWEIHPAVKPLEGEQVFEKTVNSAFRKNPLAAYLSGRGIKKMILVGMQSEYCIDATCKSAFDLGYQIVIPEGCTTTYPRAFLSGKRLAWFYEQCIWKGRFAEVIPLAQLIGGLPSVECSINI